MEQCYFKVASWNLYWVIWFKKLILKGGGTSIQYSMVRMKIQDENIRALQKLH